MNRLVSFALLVPLWCACGARTQLSQIDSSSACHATPPICVQSASDPCGAPTTVLAQCDTASHAWTCPSGARVYQRALTSTEVCRPFHGASGLESLGAWGLSAMSRVPTDDGRCLWIADSATLAGGTVARNVALEADPNAPFGTCPTESLVPPTPIVTIEGPTDPSILVQIDGGYRLAGATHVLYRIFRADPNAAFGAIELGGGVARWDPQTQRIVVPSPSNPFPWGLDLDLGDAQLASDDGEHAFVWGCSGPADFLKQSCRLARLDAQDHIDLITPKAFGSGSWTSSVVPVPNGFRHVYVADFGSEIETDDAADPMGPWSPGPNLAACDLPKDDPNAFCAGPIVHLELSDPTRPGELAMTYGVGSSKSATGIPDDYWPRLIWAK